MGLTGRLGVLPAGDDDRLSRHGRAGGRPLLVTGFVCACLAAGGVMLALGDRVAGGEPAIPALGVLEGEQHH